MLKKENRGDPSIRRIASILYFHSKFPIFTQNRTAGKLKLLPMKRPTPYSPPFPLFFPFFLLLLLFLPCPPSSSFLFSFRSLFSSSLPLLFLSPLFTTEVPTFHPPLFVTPFFCCSSSIDFQHEPAHFSNTKDCDPIYRIPVRRLDTTLRADQSSRRPTLHPS